MPKRSNSFQQLVFSIQHQITSDATVTESKYLIDRQTGSEVEVDIVIQASPGDAQVIIGIEVRDRSRRATVEWVRESLGKHATLPTHKLVLISKSGFTKEALNKAEQNDIDALTLEDAEDYPWGDRVKELCSNNSLKLTVFDITCLNYEVNYYEGSTNTGEKSIPLVISDKITFHNPENGDVIKIINIPGALLHDKRVAVPIMDRWVKEEKEHFCLTWNAPQGSYAEDKCGNTYPLQSIKINGECKVKRSNPVKFEKGLYRGNEVAYANIPDIVSNPPSGGEVTLSIIDNPDKPYIGALTLPKPDSLGRRVLPMNKAEEIPDKTNQQKQ
ncbi:MAG: restriction endonuclease [Porticoccaceae bacterium]|nr:restriction endonuclease [Porticoccaceae bacterium]